MAASRLDYSGLRRLDTVLLQCCISITSGDPRRYNQAVQSKVSVISNSKAIKTKRCKSVLGINSELC